LRIAALLLITLAAVVLLLIARTRRPVDQQQLKELAEFVIETGRRTMVPAVFFFPPTEFRNFYEREAPSKGRRTKVIQVGLRPDGRMDVVLLDVTIHLAGSYTMTAFPDGREVHTVYVTNTEEPIDDADDDLKNELEFWTTWREKELTKKQKTLTERNE
jgi:hypothetical protein